MDTSVLPLAEVHLKVGDVAIKFENDEDEGRLNGINYLYETDLYRDSEVRENLEFLKQAESYEEVDFHFLSATQSKVNLKDSERRFQCDDCGKYFIRNDHLKNHKRTHTGERPYECDSCERSFSKNFDLNRHKQCVHNSLTTFFICEECGRTFYRKDHLKSHLLTHKNQSLKFDNIEADITDLLKTYTCQTCGRTFCKLENLKRHMQTHSESFNSSKNNSLDNVSDLKNGTSLDNSFKGINIHFMSSNEAETRGDDSLKSFSCEYCGRLFMRKDHLKNHERTHTGERPFQCSQCDRRFTKRFVMTRHLQNVHGVNAKMHKCEECHRMFSRTDHLKTHMKIHILAAMRKQENYKLHKCGVCEKEFTRSYNLKTHMKVHLVESLGQQEEIKPREEIMSEFHNFEKTEEFKRNEIYSKSF